ncbi:hypothetical protein DYB32_005482 [Aphanomyces invadans]|uniref:Zinc finger CCCH domain-containing protein 42 n=1 Tax=Aphanomyces invadans TaxID=157072 RepID=A0A418AUG5_9STRA|nr:hypothetical protein DYB32_005482 [Aphanomyces invadans]
MFGLYGTVAEAKVVLDEKKQSRGFGFVTYASAAAKNKAIKHMNKSTVDGRVLTVRDVIPKADREGHDSKKEEKQKVGVCWAFQKGMCDKGDACKYPHEVKDGDYGSCFEFVQSGKCKRGDECKFAHTGSKAKQADESASKDDQKAVDPDKPRVCFGFQTGKCHRGKSCLFVHELLEDQAKDHPVESKKRKRDEDPKQQLVALVAAEEKAFQAYEAAKKARQDLERQLGFEPKETPVKPLAAESVNTKDVNGEVKGKTITKSSKIVKTEQKSVQSSAKPAKAEKAPKPIKYVVPVHDDVDMGAAFDDEPPKKKTKTNGASRLKASDHRRLRQEKKKAALQRLKEKKEIEVN